VAGRLDIRFYDQTSLFSGHDGKLKCLYRELRKREEKCLTFISKGIPEPELFPGRLTRPKPTPAGENYFLLTFTDPVLERHRVSRATCSARRAQAINADNSALAVTALL